METLRKMIIDAHLLPKELAEQRLHELDDETANQLLELARSQKMFPFLYETLAKRYTLDDSHHHFAEAFTAAREALDHLLKGLQEEMRDVDYLVVKGKGIENYYPAHLTRHYLDIDMSVRHLDAFWKISNFFLRHDLEHLTTMRLFTAPDTQLVHGFARFDPLEETELHKVEIQIGAYLIEYENISGSFVCWDDLVDVNGKSSETSSLKVPDRQRNLLIYLAELMSRKQLLIRDLFDIYYLTADCSEIDVTHLLQHIQKYHLQSSVFMLYKGYLEHEDMCMPPFIEQLYRSLGAPKSYRYRFLTQHLMPYLRQRSSAYLQAAGLLCFRVLTDRWNSQERFLPLLKWTDVHWNPYEFFRLGVPVYFAKINNLETPQLTFEKHDTYYYACTPIGSYAVSLHALISDEEMDDLHEHIVQEAERMGVI